MQRLLALSRENLCYNKTSNDTDFIQQCYYDTSLYQSWRMLILINQKLIKLSTDNQIASQNIGCQRPNSSPLALRLLSASPKPLLTPSSSFSETELGGVYEQMIMIGHRQHDVEGEIRGNHASVSMWLVWCILPLSLFCKVIGQQLFFSVNHAEHSSAFIRQAQNKKHNIIFYFYIHNPQYSTVYTFVCAKLVFCIELIKVNKTTQCFFSLPIAIIFMRDRKQVTEIDKAWHCQSKQVDT